MGASRWKKAFTDATLTIAPVPCSTIAVRVDQHVQTAVLFGRVPDQLRWRIRQRQVGCHGGDALEPVEGAGGQRADDDLCAFAGPWSAS